ncbi:MAG: hypothetical protein EXR73_07465 [Myxococcales bacterium]|nr:hypothetical protein [Myxococcales bacterium]
MRIPHPLLPAALVAAMLIAAACAPDAEPPEDRFCRDLAVTRCASLARCCVPAESALPVDATTCAAIVTEQCAAAVLDPVRRGAARFQAAGAADCLARAATCGAQLLAFCAEATVGLVPGGNFCAANEECVQPALCLPADGGLQGPTSRCFVPQDEGAACGSAHHFCAPGAWCDPATTTCSPASDEGAPCAASSMCRVGLACVGGACRALAATGAPCAAPIECAGGLCLAGVCAEPCDGAARR